MGLISKAFLVGVLAVLIFVIYKAHEDVKVEIPEKGWFGSGEYREDKIDVVPFKVDVPETVLQDLRRRLENSRIQHSPLEDSENFYYGFNSKELLKIKDYWLNKYDWRKQEKIINSFTHFKTEIEGVSVHFIHQKPAKGYTKTFPILLAHGWPGNVFEFYKVIPMLTDPNKYGIQSEFAFEVVAPSIPGYGWSSAPQKTGFSQLACARVFRKVMDRLGFKKFYLQGGDWGSLVTTHMARLYPDRVYGLHLNTVFVTFDTAQATVMNLLATMFPSIFISSKELQKNYSVFEKMRILMIETGYMHIQATKPDTVGTALNDSPIGLAAYILEKFAAWTNLDNKVLPDGGLTKKFTHDELLTMTMIYWTNGNIVNSQRFYREFFLDVNNMKFGSKFISTPTAHASGLNEIYDRSPIEVSRTIYNITHYTEIPDMGHFGCFENPKGIATDVFDFVKSL